MPKPKEATEPAGVTLACFGDTHCGSTVGLQKPGQYQFEGGNVSSDERRRSLYRRFVSYAETVAERRQGRRLITAFMGDLVDGVHHDTPELLTRYMHEQREIFYDLAWEYRSLVRYSAEAGDRDYILRGTDNRQTHGSVADANEIGKELGAVPYRLPKKLKEFDEHGEELTTGGWYPWSKVELEIYGNLIWIVHHAPFSKGTRAHTIGNAMRSWTRSMQQQRDARREQIPRYVICAHKHTAHSETVQFDNGTPEGPLTTAVITPAFQGKTEWVNQTIPLALPTTIGGWWANFEPDGSTYSKLEYTELPLGRKPEVIG